MTRFKFIACALVSIFFIHSCSKILEPISFFEGAGNGEPVTVQEEFDINVESLTFESAQKANNAAYPRRLMFNGRGAKANVFDEADFLTSNIPLSSKRATYLLGIGDKLSFTQVNEFLAAITLLPVEQLETNYLLGVGDELTFVQLNELVDSTIISGISNADDDETGKKKNKLQVKKPNDQILETSGIVGTNGNILLLGLGNISAANRTLNDIQTEVRNILIRKGLAPSFQLEITGFNSKKAFVTFPGSTRVFGRNIVPITNLPVTLKELVMNYGVGPASQNTTTVTLIRDALKFHMTAGQLFVGVAQSILIKDRDQIEIVEAATSFQPVIAVVGSRGNILLPGVGSIKAANRSLNEVQLDITKILLKKGLTPSFQLEFIDFNSKKFYLITKDYGSKVVPITSVEVHLQEAILNNVNRDVSANINNNSNILSVVELLRGNQKYRITLDEILNGGGQKIWIQDGDQIELKDFTYTLGQVFALGGAGNAKIVTIDPSQRETLADILFVPDGALSNVLAKRSEVYLLRGRNPSVAYHLDAQNVSRILVAAQTELRPNDIVYVADRPIISFSRSLAEINPLRMLLRDFEDGNIP